MTSRRFLLSTLVTAALVPSARVSGQTPTDSSASPLTVSGSFTQFFQGPNATEGGTTEVEYGGRLDVTARLDTKKLGLWPGGLFTAKAFTRYGDSGNESVNTGIPVSAALIDPATTGTTTALNELTYTHF